MKNLQKELLNGLKVVFDEDSIAAILRNEGEEGSPITMLSVLLDDFTVECDEAIGEFFFASPSDLVDGLMTFQSVITFAENVDEEDAKSMDEVAAVLNFYIESGSFCKDLNGNYTFRQSILLDSSMDANVLQSLVEMNATYAIGVASKYADLLIKVANKVMTLDEIKALI